MNTSPKVVREKTKQLIRRMINFGYSNADIVQRLRKSEDLVNAIRKQIELENDKK